MAQKIVAKSPSFFSVDQYIESQPEHIRPILATLRNTICQAVPEAEELIAYRMPTYHLYGSLLLHFAAWKKHISLYPASAQLVAHFKDQVTPYLAAKSTLQFPFSKPMPLDLIARIAQFRAGRTAP